MQYKERAEIEQERNEKLRDWVDSVQFLIIVITLIFLIIISFQVTVSF